MKGTNNRKDRDMEVIKMELYGAGDTMRVEVGPAEMKNGEERIQFGMGAEVHVTKNWFIEMDEGVEGLPLKVGISQGGIGGQDVATARARSAAFTKATDVAEFIENMVRAGHSLDTIAETLKANNTFIENGYNFRTAATIAAEAQ